MAGLDVNARLTLDASGFIGPLTQAQAGVGGDGTGCGKGCEGCRCGAGSGCKVRGGRRLRAKRSGCLCNPRQLRGWPQLYGGVACHPQRTHRWDRCGQLGGRGPTSALRLPSWLLPPRRGSRRRRRSIWLSRSGWQRLPRCAELNPATWGLELSKTSLRRSPAWGRRCRQCFLSSVPWPLRTRFTRVWDALEAMRTKAMGCRRGHARDVPGDE